MAQSGGGINGHSDPQCNGAKHSSQYVTLSRSSVDSALTTVGVELGNDETAASFTAAISTHFPLYDRWDDTLHDNPIWLALSRWWLVGRLFDLGRLFVYQSSCSLVVTLSAVFSTTLRDTPASATVQFCCCSNVISYCAQWTAVVVRRRSSWGYTRYKRVDISVSWAQAYFETLVAI